MAYEAMFATISPFLVIYDNTTKASINLLELTELEPLKLGCLPSSKLPIDQTSPFFDLMFTFSPFGLIFLKSLVSILESTCKLKPQAFFGPTFFPFGIKSPKSPKQTGPRKLARSSNHSSKERC
jgi:hypothetical protein